MQALESLMQINIPEPPVPLTKKKLPLVRVAARWKVPTWFARKLLTDAGIELVKVEQPTTTGVRMTDLLRFEQEARAHRTLPEVVR
jgi:hypothetical protein